MKVSWGLNVLFNDYNIPSGKTDTKHTYLHRFRAYIYNE